MKSIITRKRCKFITYPYLIHRKGWVYLFFSFPFWTRFDA